MSYNKLYVTSEFLRDRDACATAQRIRSEGLSIMTVGEIVDKFVPKFCERHNDCLPRYGYRNILAWVAGKRAFHPYWFTLYSNTDELTIRELREICILGVTALLRRYYSEKR